MSLFDAINKNDIDECEKLIQKGADVNQIHKTFDMSPLDYAISYDHRNIVSLLRKNGAKLHRFMKEIAKLDDDINKIEFILKKFKVDLNDKKYFEKNSPLFKAIYCNRYEMLKLLLNYGANPFFENTSYSKLGKTNAIEYAIAEGDYTALEIITNFLEEKNNKICCLLVLSREHDEKSLLHRDYLPLDLFRLIFRVL